MVIKSIKLTDIEYRLLEEVKHKASKESGMRVTTQEILKLCSAISAAGKGTRRS